MAGIGKTALVRAAVGDRAHRVGGALSLLLPRAYAALERAVRVRLTGSPVEVAELVLAELGGDVLVVEDLHWAHESTLEALTLLVDEVPMLLTSRPERLDRLRLVLDERHWLHLEPLGYEHAARLALARHPGISESDLRSLLEAAGGNPLLLERLVDDELGLSPSLQAAITHRLEDLDAATRRTIGQLALLGRPAEPRLLSEPSMASDLVEVLPDGRRTLRHAAMATAVSKSLSGEIKRWFHAELAELLERAGDDGEAAAHAYAAGERRRAHRLAARSASRSEDPGERAYLHQLAADAAAEDAVAARHRASAVEDHVAAGRWAEAIAQARLVDDRDPAHAADAALHRGRAEWFLGNVDEARRQLDRAEALAAGDDARVVRILNERTFLEVRDRVPGCLERAQRAAEAASRHGGLPALRARSTLGAALAYANAPGWESALRSVLGEIADAGDAELESATAFHLVSGLAFHGQMREAVEVAGVHIERARAAGLGSWVTSMEELWFAHRGVISAGLGTMIDDADAHLRRHRISRHRDNVHLGRLLAELDLGRFDDARHTLAQVIAESSGTPDDRVKIANLRAELAWYVDDLEMAGVAVDEARSTDGAYFGLQTLAERTAAHVFLRHGEPFEPQYPATSVPLWWSAVHEIQGLVALAAGDSRTAVTELRHALEHFTNMRLPRWMARAGMAAGDAAARHGDRSATELRQAAIRVARDAGLVGVLHRFGVANHPALTFTEESVLRRVALGETSREVAAVLGISPGTVDQHVESARRKLGAATRLEAAVLIA